MLPKPIDLSFVILTWNSAAYIQACLDSILTALNGQSINYEIFVVDNGSSDQTETLLRDYHSGQPDIIKPIFLLNNMGTTVSRNIGLKQATGRFLCIMDSDVVLPAETFASLLDALQQDPAVGMVVPKINYPSGRWQKSYDQFPTLAHKAKRFFRLRVMEAEEEQQQTALAVRPVDYAISAFWLFKRELLEVIGYLDERIFYSPEDVDYCLRVWKAGYTILYVPTVTIVHHTQEISRGVKLNKAKISHVKGLFYLFLKHRYFIKPPRFVQPQALGEAYGKDLAGIKILHVFDHSIPLHDGYSFRSLNILREQKKRGWHPVAVTSSKHEENLNNVCPAQEELAGFTFFRSGTAPLSNIPLLAELWQMHLLSRRILSIAKAEAVDTIHAHSPILNALPALWAARKLGLPLIYEIRAFWEDAAVDQGSCKEWGLRYRLTRAIETWVCRKVDHVAILCDGLKDDLVKRGIAADKITPVFNGVNADDFRSCAPDAEYLSEWQLEGKAVIGFIGSFYRYEGLDLLIRSFARIAKQRHDVVLLLVGGGEVEAELKALAVELGLKDRVVMPGRVPHDRVPGVYALVDVLAYPRYSMRLTELVTPLKPLEAMAMGKPLVASDVGGHRELIADGETGMLFNAGDEGALADSLALLLTDGDRRDRLQHRGLQWVREQQTWERTTRVYSDIYAKL